MVEKNKKNTDRTTNGWIAKNQRTKSFLFNCSEPDASYRNDHSKNSPYEHGRTCSHTYKQHKMNIFVRTDTFWKISDQINRFIIGPIGKWAGPDYLESVRKKYGVLNFGPQIQTITKNPYLRHPKIKIGILIYFRIYVHNSRIGWITDYLIYSDRWSYLVRSSMFGEWWYT